MRGLLDQLAGHNFDQITPELRENILAFLQRSERAHRDQEKAGGLAKNPGRIGKASDAAECWDEWDEGGTSDAAGCN